MNTLLLVLTILLIIIIISLLLAHFLLGLSKDKEKIKEKGETNVKNKSFGGRA